MDILLTTQLKEIPIATSTVLTKPDYVFRNDIFNQAFDVDGWLPYDLVMFGKAASQMTITDKMGSTGDTCIQD